MIDSIVQLREQFFQGRLSKKDFIDRALKFHQNIFDYVDLTNLTDVDEINISSEGVKFHIQVDDIWLFAPSGESRVAPIEILNFSSYEPTEVRLLDALCARSTVIFDIGANIGYYSVRLAKKFPDKVVYSFEPVPTSFAFLEKNVAINGVEGSVFCYSFGLSDRTGPSEFYIAPSACTNASMLNVAKSDAAIKVVIETMTLDDWCQSQNVCPDMIKCDVEGAELLVFKGGMGVIGTNRPIVICELLRKWSKPFGYHPNEVLSYFESLGYICFAIGNLGGKKISSITDQTEETNFVFLHPSIHSKELEILSNNG